MNKILVIDDNFDNLITAKAVIKSHLTDNEVITALSGPEGIKVARKEKPDVILLDIIMPGMDGYEVCRDLKNYQETSNIPVIMITAIKTDSASRIKALNLGADAFISKPIDPGELVAQVKVALRIKHSEDLLREEKMNIEQTVKERTAEVWTANKKLKQEIEEKKRTEIKLTESQKQHQTILQTAMDGFWLTDLQGNFLEVNDTYCSMSGYTHKELLSMSISDVETVESEIDIINHIQKVIKNGEDRFDSKQRRKDESIFDVEIGVKYQPELGGRLVVFIKDITDRKTTEAKIRKSEAEYRSIFEKAPIGIALVDSYNGQFIEVNQAFSNIAGWPINELNQKNWMCITHPDDIQKDADFMDLLNAGEISGYSTNKRYLKKNGDVVWIQLTVALKDERGSGISHHLAMIEDITDRIKAENELRKLSRAVEQSPVSVVITDLNGKIEYVNENFVKLTGYSAKEVIGQNPRILKSGEMHSEDYKKMWDDISSGKSWTGEFHNKKKNGELYWENAFISPIVDSNGNMKHFLAIKEDVSEKKQMTENLVDALAKAKESDRLKSAFLATMSHELRTPLNAIIGFSEMVIEETDPENSASFAKIINTSGIHLLNIIEDLFDVTLIESGEVHFSKTEVNLNYFFDEIFNIIKIEQKQLNKENIDIQYLPDSERDLVINSDERKLRQILLNLLKNALKFTERGSIKFGFSLVQQNGFQSVRVFVEDTGIGIPKEKESIIFDAFRQADDSHTRKYGGVGLGLTITKKLVEILGGNIELITEVGKGSIFSFVLPISDFIKIEETDISKPLAQSLKHTKILVAEDDEASLMLVKIYLSENSSEILWAQNGKEAVEIYKNNTDIALILMDVNMPVQNGLDATKEIKAINPSIPIIAQTAYAISGDKEKMLAAGCDDYISKPINKKLLFELIQKYLD